MAIINGLQISPVLLKKIKDESEAFYLTDIHVDPKIFGGFDSHCLISMREDEIVDDIDLEPYIGLYLGLNETTSESLLCLDGAKDVLLIDVKPKVFCK